MPGIGIGAQTTFRTSAVSGDGGPVELENNSIMNAHVNTNAAIEYSKLALSGAITNNDLAGSINNAKLLQITDKAKLHGSILYSDIDNDLGVHFLEQTILGAAPANPGSDDEVRLYFKRIDANNVGYYIKMEKAGAITEVQIA